MSKQTAVEWLHNQWANEREWTWEKIENWFEQAKAMEREQIEKAYHHGSNNGYMYAIDKNIIISRERYYDETYKGAEQ